MSVILDGAMGTELVRRGFELRAPNWSAAALSEAPEMVRGVHRDSARAGAQVITSNTFSVDNVDPELVATAVDLVRSGIEDAQDERSDGDRVRIAGSIGALARRVTRDDGEPQWAEIAAMYAGQARCLVNAGCDLLFVETIIDVEDAKVAVDAISAERLQCPVWISVACQAAGALLGVGDATDLPVAGVDAIIIACSEGAGLGPALGGLPPTFAGWRGVAPSTALTRDGTFTPDAAPPDALLAQVVTANNAHGLDVVGGCCGTTPRWLRALAGKVHANEAGRAQAFDALSRHVRG